MSQSHIPQPNTTPAAPAETYSSTDEAPHGQTISKIQTPGPPPQEIPAHTTAFNGLDPMLYQQYMYCDSFTWSTSDTRGKLLWYKPVHPRSIHKVMDRLCTIYNAWGGSMNIQFKVAGTGFHAGALAFVKIPPNFDPKSLAAGFDWTVFPYEVIDVKALECDALQCGDQRQVAYHYTIGDPNDPKSWDHGGWIACFVYLGLNTAPSGTQQVQIMITAKPGNDFQFSQMKMPSIEDDIKLDSLPPGFEELCELKFKTLSFFGGTLGRMHVLPSSITDSKRHSQTVVRFDTGEFFDEKAVSCFRAQRFWSVTSRVYMLIETPLAVTSNTTDQVTTHLTNKSDGGWDSLYSVAAFHHVIAPSGGKKAWDFNINSVKYNVDGDSSTVQIATSTKPPDDMPASRQYMLTAEGSLISTADGVLSFSPPLSESIIAFSFSPISNSSGYIHQPLNFALQALATPFLKPDMCCLFALVDDEELPIMYVKMYPEGFFTTKARKDQYTLVINTSKLKFQNFISRTTQIPENSPEMRFNFKMSAFNTTKSTHASERSH